MTITIVACAVTSAICAIVCAACAVLMYRFARKEQERRDRRGLNP